MVKAISRSEQNDFILRLKITNGKMRNKNMILIAGIVGAMIGGSFGFIIACFCISAGRAENRDDR